MRPNLRGDLRPHDILNPLVEKFDDELEKILRRMRHQLHVRRRLSRNPQNQAEDDGRHDTRVRQEAQEAGILEKRASLRVHVGEQRRNHGKRLAETHHVAREKEAAGGNGILLKRLRRNWQGQFVKFFTKSVAPSDYKTNPPRRRCRLRRAEHSRAKNSGFNAPLILDPPGHPRDGRILADCG
jgi:hypothetical protein